MSDYTIETAPPIIDGMVHLTYYIHDAQLSFVWSGRITEPIHVQHGGYGEATVALINPEPRLPRRREVARRALRLVPQPLRPVEPRLGRHPRRPDRHR